MKNDNDTEDDRYFLSYAYTGIHEEMLKDTVRTKSYYRAIVSNGNLFDGKIVLDVGCGTGILSMFAADAGAKHVYAVDKSGVIDCAKKIILLNNYEGRITLIKSRIEDTELPVHQVDIIISEWMGYCLFFESMLDSVIFARNKWLRPNGLMFPDVASLFVVGIEDEEFRDEKVEWWRRVYGYDMTPMREVAITEPLVDCVNREAVITTEALVRRFDLYTVQLEDITSFTSKVTMCCTRKDFLHAFVFYFSVEFNACHKNVVIYTGPDARPTHWKQTVFYLPKPLLVYPDQEVCILTSISKNIQNTRHLDIELSHLLPGGEKVKETIKYCLS